MVKINSALTCTHFCPPASFEVKINDQLVHSKLQTMSFPDFKEVVTVVKEVSDGSAPRQVEKVQPASCVIV